MKLKVCLDGFIAGYCSHIFSKIKKIGSRSLLTFYSDQCENLADGDITDPKFDM